MMDGIAIIDRVPARGALAKVLDKVHLDLTTTIGKELLALFSAPRRANAMSGERSIYM